MSSQDANEMIQLMIHFNDALNARDLNAMTRMMTDDCVFENTDPAPDGSHYAGQKTVRAFWEEFFRAAREPHIAIEEIFAHADRCTMRWTYSWLNENGTRGHVRGVDVYKIRGGLIAEKLSYVKG